MITSIQTLTGQQAFDQFISLAFPNGGKIWFKFGHNQFFVADNATANPKIYETRSKGTDRKRTQTILSGYEHLRDLSFQASGGVFFIPGKPDEFPLKDYCRHSDLLSCEMDDGSSEEQWERLKWFSQVSNLQWTAIVGSGGKSDHGHIRLEKKIPIELRTHFQKLLSLILRSDPAVISPHQPMRMPGFFRKEKGREQSLVAWSETQYSVDQVWAGFRKCFDALGWQFHHPLSDERWQQLRTVITNKKVVRTDAQKIKAIAKLLAKPEEEFQYKPAPVRHSADLKIDSAIPLEEFLSKENREDFERGVAKGGAGRVPTAFKIASNLAAAINSCQAAGIQFSGDGFALLEDFCNRCSPSIVKDAARIWRDASRRVSSSHFGTDYVRVRASYYLWEQVGKPTGKAYIEWAKEKGFPVESNSDGQPKTKLLTHQEWWEKFGWPNEIKTLTAFIQKHYNRAAYKYFRRTGVLPASPQPNPQMGFLPNSDTTAIVKWETPLKLYTPPIQYVSGQLPTYSAWVEMGCPKLIFKKGDRKTIIAEAYQKGYPYVKDSSAPAQGKSHDSGEIDFELLGIEIDPKESKQHRIWNINSNYRNPSTSSVEQRYTPLIARHEGLDYDPNRKTPLGRPHVVRHNPTAEKPAPDIAPPCIEWEAFREAGKKDRVVFGGDNSPICQSCIRLANCGYLKGRAATLNNKQFISADINGMSQPEALDIGIIEEAGISLKNNKKISVSLREIEATIGKLVVSGGDERIYGALLPVLDAVHRLISEFDAKNKRHGAHHSEVAKSLPQRQLLEQQIWELFSDDWIDLNNDVWGNPIWHYNMSFDESGNRVETAVLARRSQPIVPNLRELADECDARLETNLARLVSIYHSPEEKAELIRQNLLFNWVSPLLKVLSGSRRYSLQIKGKTLQVTQPFYRHQNIVKGFGFVVFMDATLSVKDLSQKLNLQAPLLEIQQTAPDNSNLTINVVNGIGHCGRQREIKQKVNGQYVHVESEYSLKNRIRHAVLEIANAEGRRLQHHRQAQSIAVIDHKAFEKDYGELIKHQIINLFGYWHRDTRGTNRFLNTEVMINVGKPTPNLGDLAAQWQTMTGEIVNPTNLTGEYGAWVKRQTIAEIIQDIGRLRAHIRPHQQLASWHLCNLDNAEIAAIKRAYPGATVNIIEAYDLCPEAATKGVHTAREIVKAIWDGVSTGVNVTADAIASQLGMSQGNVSLNLKRKLGIGFKALKKILQTLFNALYRKCNISESLSEDELWIAKQYLPMVWKQIEEANDPVVAASEMTSIAQSFGWPSLEAILGAADDGILIGLLKSLVRLLPVEIHQQLDLAPG